MSRAFARHQTVHSSLKKQIETLISIPGVDRVILEPSKGCRHNRPVGSIKIQTTIKTGIRLIGYSDRGISQFVAITSDPTTVLNSIRTKLNIRESS
jgi:hypothetical protein